MDSAKGVPLQDVWTDIFPINSQAQERLGYPTQKPEALLERIIAASSNESDVVLDPCCGCGSTIAAAQKLNRRWIGIDITSLAISLIRHRLEDSFSVKAGHLAPSHLRDLRGVIDREHAEIGVLLCMEEPTAPMRKEAASAGFYTSPWGKHPRLQILTIEDLLTGKTLDRPPAQTSVTFKRAPKAETPAMKGSPLDFGAIDDEPTDEEQD